MKTLIFMGSARANGHTKAMIDLLVEHLEGEIDIVDAYRLNIKPCQDCRYCWYKRGCSINDEMQEIYEKIDQANNIIIASPIYFHSVTGELKRVFDRLQVYWAGCIRKDKPKEYSKKGAALFVGGAPRFDDQFLGGQIVAKGVLSDLRATYIAQIELDNSDHDSLENRLEIKAQIIELAKQLNCK